MCARYMLIVCGLTIFFALDACANFSAPTVTSVPPTVTANPSTSTPVLSTATATRVSATSTPRSTWTATPVQFDVTKLKAETDAVMTAFMREQNIVGCSLVIVYPEVASGKLQKQFFNYGTLARNSKTPVDSTTLYEIGSLTKLFTADLLALNVNSGAMQLDDPLQKYLPSNVHVPTFNTQTITLVQLATHTSALPRRPENVPQFRALNGVQVWGYMSDQEIFNFINSYHLTRSPGSQWEYSNLAFGLLGIAEERLANASYENLVVTKIAEPLGLSDTRIVLTPAQETRLAQGYAADGNKAPSIATSGGTLGAGALRATIQDLATYLVANITPDQTALGLALQTTQQPQPFVGPNPHIVPGLAWNIANPNSADEELNKDGATAGYNAYIAFSKTSHNGFAAMCNGQNLSKVVPSLLKLVGETEIPLVEDE